jgi:hypothetical protein
MIDGTLTAQSNARVMPPARSSDTLNNWYYFYFTPPAELVGLSGMRT